jgi:hypothetical protein
MPVVVEADVLELLRELIAEVKGLRADLSVRGQVLNCPRADISSLSRADLALLGRLLPAIGGALGSEAFLARDLFEHESAALRLVRRGLNAKRIGRLLHRAEGHAIDGYLIERAGVELGAILWRVVQAPETGSS